MVFLDMTQYKLIMVTKVSEEAAASIFRLAGLFHMLVNLFATVLRLQGVSTLCVL
jgi:hypothetical protein